MLNYKKYGQSILEYTLILAVIVVGVIAAGSYIQGSVKKKIDTSGSVLSTQGQKLHDKIGKQVTP